MHKFNQKKLKHLDLLLCGSRSVVAPFIRMFSGGLMQSFNMNIVTHIAIIYEYENGHKVAIETRPNQGVKPRPLSDFNTKELYTIDIRRFDLERHEVIFATHFLNRHIEANTKYNLRHLNCVELAKTCYYSKLPDKILKSKIISPNKFKELGEPVLDWKIEN